MSEIMTATDGYKLGHIDQYEKDTSKVVSNLTPRKSRIEGIDHVAWAGQQRFIKKYLIKKFQKKFFKLSEDEAVKKYYRRVKNYLPAGSKDVRTDHIRSLHRLGYLPLVILSLPEGVCSPIRVPQTVIYNTIDEFYWVVNYIETLASCEIWKPCTSATIAREYKVIFDYYAMLTVGDTAFTQWQGHDFSMRGMSGLQDAMSSGFGHLISFTGTDTIPAIEYCEKWYNADCEKELIGGSVAATEHAVMCSSTGFYIWDKHNGDWIYQGAAELAVFKRLITETYPDGIVSIVSDTWDLWRVLTQYMVELKDVIMARNGKLVIRPDSGDPVKILTGYTIDELNAMDKLVRDKYIACGADKGVIQLLAETFGTTMSPKGYKLLNEKVGAIYGDSITIPKAIAICQRLMDKQFASINWVAGIGSYTYQYQTRDTFGYAQKSTYCEVKKGDKVYCIPIFKDPVTDDGTKKSARGLTAVYKDANGEYYLKDNATWEEMLNCELKMVFKDGKLLIDQSLAEIRQRMAESIKKDVEKKLKEYHAVTV